jgi:hypothetical protein
MHGFRRAVAGDVARSTGNLKLAMEYIGDTDVRRAREYFQVRPDHLKEAASVMDREHPDRTQTVPEPGAAAEPGLELVGAGGPTELPRQDSNLRPVEKERARHRARAQKSKRLAGGESRRHPPNPTESHAIHRTQTVLRDEERDG